MKKQIKLTVPEEALTELERQAGEYSATVKRPVLVVEYIYEVLKDTLKLPGNFKRSEHKRSK